MKTQDNDTFFQICCQKNTAVKSHGITATMHYNDHTPLWNWPYYNDYTEFRPTRHNNHTNNNSQEFLQLYKKLLFQKMK